MHSEQINGVTSMFLVETNVTEDVTVRGNWLRVCGNFLSS